jgi:Tol biopolymer transport system component
LLRTSTDCDSLGRADAPAWSTDGRWIVFIASPPTPGGTRRLDAPWDLYAMEADRLEPRRLVGSISSPLAVAVSPDGGVVAFSGTLLPHGPGIWLVVRETGAVRRLCSCSSDSLAFNEDGRSIAAIESSAVPSAPSRVMVFVLPAQ